MSIEAAPREAVQFGRAAEAFILLILAEGRSYGYQIRQRLQEEFDYQRAADAGALYRLLRDLEAAGLIASEWDIAETGPARRYYQLTPEGHTQLQLTADRLTRQAKRIERFFEVYETIKTQPATAGSQQ
ncbi:MAG TPA: PadR family transcriptional regulator [Chloroflexota bacterium]|nr:PadR family transcriptional regulator [Chloroflexota bacterium]